MLCQHQLSGFNYSKCFPALCVSAGFLIEPYIFCKQSSVSPAWVTGIYRVRTRRWVTYRLSEAARVFSARATLYYWTAAILSLAASILCGQSAVWSRFICRENMRHASLARTHTENHECEQEARKFYAMKYFCLVPLSKGIHNDVFHSEALRISLSWCASCSRCRERRLYRLILVFYSIKFQQDKQRSFYSTVVVLFRTHFSYH